MVSSEEKQPRDETEQHEVADEAPETLKDLSSAAAAQGQGLSGFEDLSAWETIKLFKYSSLFCFLASVSAAAEGYQIGYVCTLIDLL